MANVLKLPTAIRDVRRYVEVLSVLIRYGFGDIVQELKLKSILDKGMSLVGGESDSKSAKLPRPIRLRLALEELGPTFIKLGQILSTRPDLIPTEWCLEFKRLQDRCTPLSYETILTRLEAEFLDTLPKKFLSIDPEPLATASISQVHRAVLKNGTPVLLKIVRPGTEDLISGDIHILQSIARFGEEHFGNLGYSPTEVVKEFSREINREVDLTYEARATERFRSIFQDDPDIVFPKIFWNTTTSRVLTLEEIKGRLLSRTEPSEIDIDERKKLVANGARAVFRQCLEIGFFHADPHPGNLIALPGGKMAFIDFGMVGQIDKETMELLADLVSGIVDGDVGKVARAVGALANASPEEIDDRGFRSDVREFVSHFEHTPLGLLDIGVLLDEFFAKLRAHKLRCPADLVLLIKALTTIESVGREYDPEFDAMAFAQPYIENLVRRRYDVSAVTDRIGKSLIGYAEFVETLPLELGQLLTQLRRNKVAVNLEHRGLDQVTSAIENASRNISFSLIMAGTLVGSSILVLAADRGSNSISSLIGTIGFAAACILILLRVITNRRRTK